MVFSSKMLLAGRLVSAIWRQSIRRNGSSHLQGDCQLLKHLSQKALKSLLEHLAGPHDELPMPNGARPLRCHRSHIVRRVGEHHHHRLERAGSTSGPGDSSPRGVHHRIGDARPKYVAKLRDGWLVAVGLFDILVDRIAVFGRRASGASISNLKACYADIDIWRFTDELQLDRQDLVVSRRSARACCRQ